MSRKPAGVSLTAASALLAVSMPLFAQEVGTKVEFPASPARVLTLSAPQTGGAVVYDSGPSGHLRDSWDNVLFHGTSSDPATTFEASRKLKSGWTAWKPATVSRHGHGRFWGKVSFEDAGPGAVRIRALSPTGPAAVVNVLGVDVFLASDDRDHPGAFEAAPPVVDKPIDLFERSTWGARKPKEPYEPHTPVKITLHHTDGPQTMTVKASEEEVKFIQDFHMNGRGWNDIAYHFLVDGAGHVFEGRPENVVGAHTKNNNTGNIGIALLGTYHAPKNNQLNAVEEAAVAAVGRYLVAKYGIEPQTLKGHRDYGSTDCPGDIAYAKLGELRRLFAEKPAQPQPGVVSGKMLALPRAPMFDGAK